MTDLPQLRPTARYKAYYDELRAILATVGPRIRADVEAFRAASGKLTVEQACILALRYRLKLAALFSFLEDEHICACGAYDSLKERGLKPMAILTEVWQDMQASDVPPR